MNADNNFKNRFLLTVLLAVGSIMVGPLIAETFTTLHTFTGSEGAFPDAGLILSGSVLYGTADGGTVSQDTVFAVRTDGTGFTNLHSFSAIPDSYPYTNTDGAVPLGGLILSGNTLYGTARGGGTLGAGVVFAVNTNGSGFSNLHNFTPTSYNSATGTYTNSDGAVPLGGLILSDNTLFGTTTVGGTSGGGTVFAVNTDGTGFRTLHIFTPNTDGASPDAGLILSGGRLYGTASSGGNSSDGTVFALNTNGTGFTTLFHFNGCSNGTRPIAGLILLGTTLYGTTGAGGTWNQGTVFALNTNGTGFRTLHIFTATGPNGATGTYTNSDGAYPYGSLIISSNTLCGTTFQGGSSGHGTVFAVNTNGTSFTTLHSFTAIPRSYPYTNSDGAYPQAGLVLSGNTLYGTAIHGGSSGFGTVFSLPLTLPSVSPPQLTLTPYGANVILTWPTNATGFILQSTPNLVSPTGWTTVSPGPVVISGQNLIINPISGGQQFFRLSQ